MISQQNLSDSVGLSRTNLYNYLSPENTTIKMLDKISKTVRLPIAELFNKEEKSIIGYVEFNNFIYKISSPADFELVIEDFKKYFSKNNPTKK
jgi:transcriptional regulator with XRE-family HTH domain